MEKIYFACCAEIDSDMEKWDYWHKLKCLPEHWFDLLIVKLRELESDDVDKSTRDALSGFILLMEETIINDAPKTITEFLEYMVSMNPSKHLCTNWDEYKTTAEIIVECFQKAS